MRIKALKQQQTLKLIIVVKIDFSGTSLNVPLWITEMSCYCFLLPHDVTLLRPVAPAAPPSHVLSRVLLIDGFFFLTTGSERHSGLPSGSLWRRRHQHVPVHQSAPLRDPGDHHQRHPQALQRGLLDTLLLTLLMLLMFGHAALNLFA